VEFLGSAVLWPHIQSVGWCCCYVGPSAVLWPHIQSVGWCCCYVGPVCTVHTGPTLCKYTNRNKTIRNCFYDKKLQRVYPRKGKPANCERVFFDLAEINAEIWRWPRELVHWHFARYRLVRGMCLLQERRRGTVHIIFRVWSFCWRSDTEFNLFAHING
jgi:hypothetical protein